MSISKLFHTPRYGDHTQDVHRFCRFAKVRVLHEGVDDLQMVEGLEWEPRVHA